MKIPTRPRQMGLNFDITPLIDVVFQLIIFFLAATYILHSDASEKVQLPKATQTDSQPSKSASRWTITITAERAWLLGNQRSDRATIEQQLMSAAKNVEEAERLEVRIRADARVPFSEVEPLMIACAKLGIRKLGFAVVPDAAD